jgi:hypothetical protein
MSVGKINPFNGPKEALPVIKLTDEIVVLDSISPPLEYPLRAFLGSFAPHGFLSKLTDILAGLCANTTGLPVDLNAQGLKWRAFHKHT